MLIPSAILGYFAVFHEFEAPFLNVKVLSLLHSPWSNMVTPWYVVEYNVTKEIAGIFFIVGALPVASSKEKVDDEIYLQNSHGVASLGCLCKLRHSDCMFSVFL